MWNQPFFLRKEPQKYVCDCIKSEKSFQLSYDDWISSTRLPNKNYNPIDKTSLNSLSVETYLRDLKLLTRIQPNFPNRCYQAYGQDKELVGLFSAMALAYEFACRSILLQTGWHLGSEPLYESFCALMGFESNNPFHPDCPHIGIFF